MEGAILDCMGTLALRARRFLRIWVSVKVQTRALHMHTRVNTLWRRASYVDGGCESIGQAIAWLSLIADGSRRSGSWSQGTAFIGCCYFDLDDRSFWR